MNLLKISILGAELLGLLSVHAYGMTIQEDFTKGTTSQSWTAYNGACLTAGTQTTSSNPSNYIPACNGLAYYGNETQVGLTNNSNTIGSGALRFTNGYPNYHQNGAIFLNSSFPSDQGVQVTFTTYTYGGDAGGTKALGADGMGFYILNGTQDPNIGAWGGSLGYDCSNSNSPYNGMVGAYLGLGIDEYGNFTNKSDNSASGYTSSSTSPNEIGLRGYGNIALSWLQDNYPTYYKTSYSSSTLISGVQATCKSGQVMSYSGSSWKSTGTNIPDYPYIPNSQKSLPLSGCPTAGAATLTPSTTSSYPNCQPIANQQKSSTASRANAIPITYALKISSTGLLTFGYYYNGGSYQPVMTNQSIAASNGPMPASFLFGFGGSTGGSDNVHEITCFKAEPLSSSTGAASNSVQSGQLNTGTQLYMASYYPDNWWGSLVAIGISSTGTGSSATVQVATAANWDGGCVLTGGSCPSTGATSMTAESPSSRSILTSSSGAGVPFEWGNLSSTATTAFNNEAALISTSIGGQDILNWLRGVRSEEQSSGPLRTRTGVLGDIIDSSPIAIGIPSAPYGTYWYDGLYGLSGTSTYLPENATGATPYTTFSSFGTGGYGGRANIVYDGANDGLLHGFRSGSFVCNPNTSTNPNACYSTATVPNDGLEMLAYVPDTLASSSTNNVDALTNPGYSHAYYVDATPGSGDVFYNNGWHTWLAGGLGTGGSAIYALDVTDPSSFSETNAASLVKGEWNPSTISCAGAIASCGSYLGQLWGKPIFERLHNGQWAMIFGNGHNSSTGHAGIYIGLINPYNGAVTFYYLDTGAGSSSNPDGIDYVAAADLDGDYIADYVYAGDLQGNIWRFNLTSNKPSDWAVSKYGSSTATPLYTAKNGSGATQPVTTQIQVAETLLSGQTYVIVMFGTGEQIPATTSTPASYASGTQTVYGIWDWNMTNWNTGYSTANGVNVPASATQLAALSSAPALTRSNLLQQTISTSGTSRTLSNYPICPQGSSACSPASSDNQYGWYVDLPGTNGQSPTQYEQVIYNPLLSSGVLILNTTIPPGGNVISCSALTTTGWTMAFNVQTGGSLPSGFFQGSGGTYGTGSSGVNGELSNGTGTPWLLTFNNNTYLFTQASSSSISASIPPIWTPQCQSNCSGNNVPPVNPPNPYLGKRVNWEILR